MPIITQRARSEEIKRNNKQVAKKEKLDSISPTNK